MAVLTEQWRSSHFLLFLYVTIPTVPYFHLFAVFSYCTRVLTAACSQSRRSLDFLFFSCLPAVALTNGTFFYAVAYCVLIAACSQSRRSLDFLFFSVFLPLPSPMVHFSTQRALFMVHFSRCACSLLRTIFPSPGCFIICIPPSPRFALTTIPSNPAIVLTSAVRHLLQLNFVDGIELSFLSHVSDCSRLD